MRETENFGPGGCSRVCSERKSEGKLVDKGRRGVVYIY